MVIAGIRGRDDLCYTNKMTNLTIRTRLICGEFHRSNRRKTDSVPKLWVVFVVRLMVDLAQTFFFPTMLLTVIPVAEQTGLHVSGGLQIGMPFWISCPHTITDMARQHIRLFGSFMQSNNDVCRVRGGSRRARCFVGLKVVGFDYHFAVGVNLELLR
jgi:hypothetical protein